MFEPPLSLQEDAKSVFSNLGDQFKTSPRPISELTSLFTGFKDGKFADISYPLPGAITAGQVPLIYKHINRVLDVGNYAFAHESTTPAELVRKAVQALDFYARQDYKPPNWWDRQIGWAKAAAGAAILLSPCVGNSDLMSEFIPYIKKTANSELNETGANLADLAYIQLLWCGAAWTISHKIEYLYTLRKSVDTVAALCFPVSRKGNENGEGISVDYSISQHNPLNGNQRCSQLYTGSYGHELMARVFSTMAILKGSFSFPPQALLSLESLFLKGSGWACYSNHMDFHVNGRAISRGMHTNSPFTGWCDQLLSYTPENPQALIELRDRARTGNEQTNNFFVGNKVMWVNDYMAHMTQHFCVWSKAISTRTVGTESGNGENLKGYYMGCGSYFICHHGHEYENIQPVWDWQRIPGTTTEQIPDFKFPLVDWGVGAWGSHSFAGGVSNGDIGALSMTLTRNNVRNACKSVIALNDTVFFFGSRIDTTQTSHPVVTNINQCQFKTTSQIKYRNGVTEDVRAGSLITSMDIAEITHDGFTYFFPEEINQSVTLRIAEQSGSWQSINSNAKPDIVTADVFSLWLTHPKGITGGYCYAIRRTEASDTPKFSDPGIVDAHAVIASDGTLAIGTVFVAHDETLISISNTLAILPKNTVSFIFSISADKLTITCADPSQTLHRAEFELLRANRPAQIISIVLPSSDDAGRSASVVVNIG